MTAQTEMFAAKDECIALCEELGLVDLARALRAKQHDSAWAMRKPLAEVHIAATAIHAAMVKVHETWESPIADSVIGRFGVAALRLRDAAERASSAAGRYIEEDAASRERGIEPGLAIGARKGWR